MALMEKTAKKEAREAVPAGQQKLELPGEPMERVNAQAIDIRAPIKSVIANVKVAEKAYAEATTEEKKELDAMYKKMHFAGIRLGSSMMGGFASLALSTGAYQLALDALQGGSMALKVAALPGVGLDGAVAIGAVGFTLAGSAVIYFAYEAYKAVRDWAGTERLKNDKLTEVRNRGADAA